PGIRRFDSEVVQRGGEKRLRADIRAHGAPFGTKGCGQIGRSEAVPSRGTKRIGGTHTYEIIRKLGCAAHKKSRTRPRRSHRAFPNRSRRHGGPHIELGRRVAAGQEGGKGSSRLGESDRSRE